METFVNFRMSLYARDSHRVCRLHADLPKGDGLQYVSFVMYESELEQFASPVCALSDGCLRLDVWGDLCRFYDLQFPSEKKHGVAQVRYCTATIPLFVRKLMLRIARRAWAYRGEQETTVCLSQERVARWKRLYGVGSGNVRVVMSEETRAFLEVKLKEPSSNLGERLEQVKTIARNNTRAFFETSMVQLSKDWDGFFFSVPGLHGGIINHGHGPQNWSIHT